MVLHLGDRRRRLEQPVDPCVGRDRVRRGGRDAPAVGPHLGLLGRQDGRDVAFLLARLQDAAHVAVPALAQDDLAGRGVIDVAERADGRDALADREQELLRVVKLGLVVRVRAVSERHRRERDDLLGAVEDVRTALRDVGIQEVVEVLHRLGLGRGLHDGVLVEEHRDAEVLDDVKLAGRVEARLAELRIEVLDVRDQVEVELHQPAFLNELAHGVLARDDDVVAGAARVQLGEQLVV